MTGRQILNQFKAQIFSVLLTFSVLLFSTVFNLLTFLKSAACHKVVLSHTKGLAFLHWNHTETLKKSLKPQVVSFVLMSASALHFRSDMMAVVSFKCRASQGPAVCIIGGVMKALLRSTRLCSSYVCCYAFDKNISKWKSDLKQLLCCSNMKCVQGSVCQLTRI